MNVREVRGGQTASFALKKIKRSQIRKGMVMASPDLNPKACWEFEGEILVLHHPTTISSRYQAMVHCGSIRQTASIINMSRECLRTGDKACVLFRFIKHPEYIRPNQRMVFREGRTKAVGNVIKPLPMTSAMFQNRIKPNKMQSRGQQSSNINISSTTSFAVGDEQSDGVIEVSTDKRDANYRGQRRNTKRGGGQGSSSSSASVLNPNQNASSQSQATPSQQPQSIATRVQ